MTQPSQPRQKTRKIIKIGDIVEVSAFRHIPSFTGRVYEDFGWGIGGYNYNVENLSDGTKWCRSHTEMKLITP